MARIRLIPNCTALSAAMTGTATPPLWMLNAGRQHPGGVQSIRQRGAGRENQPPPLSRSTRFCPQPQRSGPELTDRDAASNRSTGARAHGSHPRAAAAGRTRARAEADIQTHAEAAGKAGGIEPGTEAGTAAGKSGDTPDEAGTTALLSSPPLASEEVVVV